MVRVAATGEACPVVGRVSMDAVTVRVPPSTALDTDFVVYSDDFDPHTSMVGRARALGTIGYEVATSLAARVPRVYLLNGRPHRDPLTPALSAVPLPAIP